MAKSADYTARQGNVLDGTCWSCPVAELNVCSSAEAGPCDFSYVKVVSNWSRGSWLFRQSDPVETLYILIEGGVVRSRADAHGDSFALHLATPGATLGFRGLIDGGMHGESAQCATDCVICAIPAKAVEAALSNNRPLEAVFFRNLANEAQYLRDRMLQMVVLGVRDRMLLLLGQLARHFGRKMDEGQLLIDTPVRRRDMGALAGMTPETVSRCIRTLQAENMAHFTRHHILIPCHERFRTELARLEGK